METKTACTRYFYFQEVFNAGTIARKSLRTYMCRPDYCILLKICFQFYTGLIRSSMHFSALWSGAEHMEAKE
jgi:hypothetical protein